MTKIAASGRLGHVGEREIRAAENLAHARAIEEMGMALRGRQHAGGFLVGLAQVAIGRARDQAALRLHVGEQRGEPLRGKRQMVAQRGEGAGRGRLAGDDMEDQAGDQRLGFIVPMRLARFAGGVIDQRIGERHGVVGEIEAGGVDAIQWRA